MIRACPSGQGSKIPASSWGQHNRVESQSPHSVTNNSSGPGHLMTDATSGRGSENFLLQEMPGIKQRKALDSDLLRFGYKLCCLLAVRLWAHSVTSLIVFPLRGSEDSGRKRIARGEHSNWALLPFLSLQPSEGRLSSRSTDWNQAQRRCYVPSPWLGQGSHLHSKGLVHLRVVTGGLS